MEYLSPQRDAGTRMLKRADELWLYTPRSERVQRISGHLTRQGMMGSDISYEDLLDSTDFEQSYQAEVLGEGELEGRRCVKLEATALREDITYAKRVIWVDAEHLVPLRKDLYALSGMLVKTWTMGDVRQVEDEHVPFRMEVADQLRQSSRTIIVVESLELEDEVFSRRWLERRY